MKKFINDPFAVVDDMLSGILKAYPYHLRMAKDSQRSLIFKDAPVKGKVGICTGGGSGHLPVFLGYVGAGLVDGCGGGQYLFLSRCGRYAGGYQGGRRRRRSALSVR